VRGGCKLLNRIVFPASDGSGAVLRLTGCEPFRPGIGHLPF